MYRKLICLAMFVLLPALGGTTQAAPITVVNPGFELGSDGNPLPGPGDHDFTEVQGWSGSAQPFAAVESFTQTPDGLWAAQINSAGSTEPSYFEQIIGTVEAGTYTVEFIRTHLWAGEQPVQIEVSIFARNQGDIELDSVSLTEQIADFTWIPQSAQLTVNPGDAGIGLQLGIRFSHGPQQGNAYTFIDNVSVSVIPEPMTVILLGFGALYLRRRIVV